MGQQRKTAVFTVHGIRTFGQWQRRLEKLVENHQGSKSDIFQFYHREYGYFSVFKFINPIFRWREVRRFRQHVKDIISREKPDKVIMVGHSFGTHVISNAIKKSSGDGDFPIVDTVILSGSVLQQRFPWHSLQPGRIKRVINECGTKDFIIAINALLPLGSGLAGRHGFDGVSSRSLQNRFFNFGHSGYFVADQNHTGDDDWFMREYWLDLVVGASQPQSIDERPAGAFQGFKTWIVDQFPNLKWTMPLLFLLVGVLTLENQFVVQANLLIQSNSKNALSVIASSDELERRQATEVHRHGLQSSREFNERGLVQFIRNVPWSNIPETTPDISRWSASESFFKSILVQSNTINDVDLGNMYFPEITARTNAGKLQILGPSGEIVQFDLTREMLFAGDKMQTSHSSSQATVDYENSRLELLDLVSEKRGEQIQLLGSEENLFHLSQSNKILITLEKLMDEGNETDKSARVYDVGSGRLLHQIPGDSAVHNMYAALSHDDRYFLTIRGEIDSYGEEGNVRGSLEVNVYALWNAAARYDLRTIGEGTECPAYVYCESYRIMPQGIESEAVATVQADVKWDWVAYEDFSLNIIPSGSADFEPIKHDKALYWNKIFDPENGGVFLVVLDSTGSLMRYQIEAEKIESKSINVLGGKSVESLFEYLGDIFLFSESELTVVDMATPSIKHRGNGGGHCSHWYRGLGRSKGTVIFDQVGNSWIRDCSGSYRNLQSGKIMKSSPAEAGSGIVMPLAGSNPMESDFGVQTIRTSLNGKVMGFANLGPGDGAYVPDSWVSVLDVEQSDGALGIGGIDYVYDFHFNGDGTILAIDTGRDAAIFDVESGKLIVQYKDVGIVTDSSGGVWLLSEGLPGFGALKVPNSLSEKLAN